MGCYSLVYMSWTSFRKKSELLRSLISVLELDFQCWWIFAFWKSLICVRGMMKFFLQNLIRHALRLGFIKGERWEVILAFWGPHFCFLINLIAFCNGYVEWCPTTYQRMRNLRSLFSIFLFSKTATICWSDCAYFF